MDLRHRTGNLMEHAMPPTSTVPRQRGIAVYNRAAHTVTLHADDHGTPGEPLADPVTVIVGSLDVWKDAVRTGPWANTPTGRVAPVAIDRA